MLVLNFQELTAFQSGNTWAESLALLQGSHVLEVCMFLCILHFPFAFARFAHFSQDFICGCVFWNRLRYVC